jgi:COP9 signalosome complex subunit 4
MACPKVSEALAQVGAASDQTAAFESLLSGLKTLSTPSTVTADLKAIIDTVLGSSSLGIVAQRAIVGVFITTLQNLDNADLTIEVGQHALAVLSNQTSTFVDQSVALRELMADAHETNEDNLEAAKILAEIPLDSSQRKVSNEDRVRVWVRIVRNYLEVDDTVSAETYLNKLKNIIYQVTDPALNLHFRLSQARIQDAKREFLSASQAYHDISFSPAISEEERLHTLGMAVKCAILAPAGPLRSRALGGLFKDERSPNLDEFGMLEKMFFDRLLSPAEVDKFAQSLAPHQLAIMPDGSTVLAKAVVDHNLLGASRLYSNISFEALGVLLDLNADKAEDTTARMIEQGRLVGRIDQIERIIWFEGGEASGEKGSGRAEVTVGREMRRWDANVQALAEEVENVTNALQREFPDFVANNLVV